MLLAAAGCCCYCSVFTYTFFHSVVSLILIWLDGTSVRIKLNPWNVFICCCLFFYVGVILLLVFFRRCLFRARSVDHTRKGIRHLFMCIAVLRVRVLSTWRIFFNAPIFFDRIFFLFSGSHGTAQSKCNVFSFLPFDIGCSLCVVFICAGRFMILFLWEPQRKHWKCAGKSIVRSKISFSLILARFVDNSQLFKMYICCKKNRSHDATAVNIECLLNRFFWLETIWKT